MSYGGCHENWFLATFQDLAHGLIFIYIFICLFKDKLEKTVRKVKECAWKLRSIIKVLDELELGGTIYFFCRGGGDGQFLLSIFFSARLIATFFFTKISLCRNFLPFNVILLYLEKNLEAKRSKSILEEIVCSRSMRLNQFQRYL